MNGLTISEIVMRRHVDLGLVGALRGALSAVPGVVGAILLGSRSRGNTHTKSNADVLLIVDRLELPMVRQVSDARRQVEKDLGFTVSINVHTLADADPALSRWGLFMHKNRAELFVYQAKYTSVVLFGRNVFENFRDPAPSALRAEAIRVTASFAYFLRKFLFDQSLAPHGAAEFVRTPLIALEYLAGFHGYISMGYQDGMDYLTRHGYLDDEAVDLLHECGERKAASSYSGVDHAMALRACDFLNRAAASMSDLYRRKGVSDVRWNGSACISHWSLDLPQAAAMTIIRRGSEVLLLRRTSDDYLYPNRWTIPGGYLHQQEEPGQGAARELHEETGLHLIPGELFDGRPLVSERLAAFAFDVEIPDKAVATRLAEHDASTFVPLNAVLDADLTTEARLVLERYRAETRTLAQKS